MPSWGEEANRAGNRGAINNETEIAMKRKETGRIRVWGTKYLTGGIIRFPREIVQEFNLRAGTKLCIWKETRSSVQSFNLIVEEEPKAGWDYIELHHYGETDKERQEGRRGLCADVKKELENYGIEAKEGEAFFTLKVQKITPVSPFGEVLYGKMEDIRFLVQISHGSRAKQEEEIRGHKEEDYLL